MKRTVALVLILMLIVAMVPVMALAAEHEGITFSYGTPFVIDQTNSENYEQLLQNLGVITPAQAADDSWKATLPWVWAPVTITNSTDTAVTITALSATITHTSGKSVNVSATGLNISVPAEGSVTKYITAEMLDNGTGNDSLGLTETELAAGGSISFGNVGYSVGGDAYTAPISASIGYPVVQLPPQVVNPPQLPEVTQPVETPEDVQEPTPDEEITEDEVIEDEVVEDEIVDDAEEEVPVTGDAASAALPMLLPMLAMAYAAKKRIA